MAHFSYFFIRISPFVSNPACMASISMGLESKERLKNGIFGILPALAPSFFVPNPMEMLAMQAISNLNVLLLTFQISSFVAQK